MKVYYGWVVITSCFTLKAIASGLFFTYGIFFLPISREFHLSFATTGSVYSVVLTNFLVFNIVGGILNDRMGPRRVSALGSVLLVSTLLVTASANSLIELYLFYGCVGGAAWGLLSSTGTVTPPRWFIRKRGFAISVVEIGTAVGTLVLPLIEAIFLGELGWRGTFWALGLAFMPFLAMASLILREHPKEIGEIPYSDQSQKEASPHAQPRNKLATSAFKTYIFWVLYIGFFIGSFTYQTVVVYLTPYAVSRGVLEYLASLSVSSFGLGSVIGRIASGTLSDRAGRLNILLLDFGFLLSATIALALSSEIYLIYFLAALIGFSTGGFVVTTFAAVADLFELTKLGTILGVLLSGFAISGILATPLAGFAFDIAKNYFWIFVLAGVPCAAPIMLMLKKRAMV